MNRIPAGILGLALAFWGWQSGLMALSFPLIVLALAPQVVRRRFDFTPQEFHRAVEVCWVLLVGALLMVYGREAVGNMFRSVARWLPMILFPALMAQVWSDRGLVPVSALIPIPTWRRQVDPRTVFDIVPVMLAACLLAASVTGGAKDWFYPGLVILGGAALWSGRPRAAELWASVVVLSLAVVGGWFAAGGIGWVQQWTEARILTMVSRWRGDEWSSRSFKTAIGRTGKVGGSSRVVLRLNPLGDAPLPPLLRVTVFTTWRGDGTWMVSRGEPEKLEGVADEWRLDKRQGRDAAAYVEWVPELTSRFLPLPTATRLIAELSAERVERTRWGAVRAEVRGGMVTYRADYGPQVDWELSPVDEDRRGFSDAELPGLKKFATEADLYGQEPAVQVQRIRDYFQRHFRYTTDLVNRPSAGVESLTAIGQFLNVNRAGHCEYFATSAALLLRHLGVPARFATGYLVPTSQRRGGGCTLREKQAHAWVLVWLDGAWRDFDPTPMALFDEEGGTTSSWDRLRQGWNDLQFTLARWWWLGEKRILRQAYWLVVPLVALLLWRLRRVREAQGPGRGMAAELPREVWPGTDSEWFEVAAWLERAGWMRYPGESSEAWWLRLREAGWESERVALASGTFALHQRLRFDPRGLGGEEREQLRFFAATLLSKPPIGPAINDGATRA